MKLKTLFLTPDRYPTEKAYGVTTGNTMRAIAQLGIEIEIWNRDNSGFDEFGNPLVRLGKKSGTNQRRLYKIAFLGISRWVYLFDQFRFSFNCVSRLRDEPRNAVVWTRFPLVGFVASFAPKANFVIIELHHQPNFVSRTFLRVIRNLKPVEVAVISQTAKLQFEALHLGIPTLILEMSVPEEFMQRAKHPLVLPAKICYLGKSKSSGKSNNLEFLLSAFSQMKVDTQNRIEFTGVESQEIESLVAYSDKLQIARNTIKFVQHMPHQKVNDYLNGISVGLVPYEMNKYNAARVPIKILEYAAKGIWILAPESFTRNLQLPPGVVLTYKDGNSTDLASKLDTLILEIESNQNRNSVAIEFAKMHTYESRARKLILELETLKLI